MTPRTVRRFSRREETRGSWKDVIIRVVWRSIVSRWRERGTNLDISSTGLQDQITEATGRKYLFNIVDYFLIKKPTLRLPAHDSLPALLDQFGQHFDKKVSDIRACLDAAAVAGCSFIPPGPLKCPLPPKKSLLPFYVHFFIICIIDIFIKELYHHILIHVN